jgi:hypothetical protein
MIPLDLANQFIKQLGMRFIVDFTTKNLASTSQCD